MKYILPLAALAMLGFAVFHVLKAGQTPPPAEPRVPPARNPYLADNGSVQKGVVAGAGIVEPCSENISVGSDVPGVVRKVFVKVGQPVKAGEPLFELDRRQLEAEERLRIAELNAAKAALSKMEAMPRQEEKPPLEARKREAEANVKDMEEMHKRSIRLHADRAIGEEELVRKRQAWHMAREQLAKADADLQLLLAGAWGPDKVIAERAVEQSDAQLKRVQTELDRLTIKAPIDGEVLYVNVRPGEFVGAPPGQQLIVLGDTRTLHVRVDINEDDILRYQSGAASQAYSRGDTRTAFPLSFVRTEKYVVPKKSLTGVNTERVDTRVLQVIYKVEPGSVALYVGMQLDVYFGNPAK